MAPGFIDAHFHAVDPFGTKLGVADGITTGMDLETGAMPVRDGYNQRLLAWQQGRRRRCSRLVCVPQQYRADEPHHEDARRGSAPGRARRRLIAVDMDQASESFRYIPELIDSVPELAVIVESRSDKQGFLRIDLNSRIQILVKPADRVRAEAQRRLSAQSTNPLLSTITVLK